ncbi:ParA family protein [Aneurinibacillus tyrosinisolvens]|uniref:ParA family protein n=1 Tax=Aneurinibacillus tyrosinisolvens TaxID=1443435 RepID=UPI00063FAAF8|nr:AAA family ATPase [Aneurinibacillus tyrosinisolvens]
MAKKIFFGNYKGGVGKTTSVYQIGLWMAKKGKKVLLIDLDPQCSLSDMCWSNKTRVNKYNNSLNFAIELYTRYISNNVTDYNLLTGKTKSMHSYLNELIVNIKNNIDFIPSTIMFKNARLNDLSSRMEKNALNVFIMALIVKDMELNENYDFILFDCPPTSNMLIHSVFMASDYYIIPTIGDKISINGVPDYVREIENVYTRYAMNDEIGGIMLNAIFGEKPKLIGVFETIYKNRTGSGNIRLLKELDDSINNTHVESLLSEPGFAKYRYQKPSHSIETKHTFADFMRNLVSIPSDTYKTLEHGEYEKITVQIIDVIK